MKGRNLAHHVDALEVLFTAIPEAAESTGIILPSPTQTYRLQTPRCHFFSFFFFFFSLLDITAFITLDQLSHSTVASKLFFEFCSYKVTSRCPQITNLNQNRRNKISFITTQK